MSYPQTIGLIYACRCDVMQACHALPIIIFGHSLIKIISLLFNNCVYGSDKQGTRFIIHRWESYELLTKRSLQV